MGEMTAERVAREVEHLRKFAQSDKGSTSYCLVHSGAILAHIAAQAEEVERLRRERETLADLLRQVDVVMDGAAMDGVKSILAPQYQDDWALVHTRVREQIVLFDGGKGGDADE